MTRLLFLASALVVSLVMVGFAEDPEDRERKALEQRLINLERGAPHEQLIEDVYGFHVERGTVEDLLGRYRKRVAENPKDGRAWLLLGLFEAQRGRYAAAAEALRKAEPLHSAEPLVSFHLGRVLVLAGHPEEAVVPLEAAVAQPLSAEYLLKAYQLLRRAYQQIDKPEKAAAALTQLRKQFAKEPAIQRRIAGELAEEGRYSEAREIYDMLAKAASNADERAGLAIAAADTAARQGLKDEALDRLAAVIEASPPDSRTAADARKRLEAIFFKDANVAGAIRFYEKQLKPNQEDPNVLARLAYLLAFEGRKADARTRLEQAVKIAPNRTELRGELIRLLVDTGDIPAALRQYEALNSIQKDDRETLHEWGKLLRRDPSKSEADRKEAAISVWQRIAEARPKDPSSALYAAEVFAQHGLPVEALKYYRRAVELRPDDPENHRYLGEYLLSQKRPAEAVAAWREMATETRRKPDNLSRLAELLARTGFPKEAVIAALEARDLAPSDLRIRLLAARLLVQDGRHPDALKELDAAAGLVRSTEEDDVVVRQQIETHQDAKTLDTAADQLDKALSNEPKAPARRWLALARFREAQQNWQAARAAATAARDLEPKSLLAWRTLARVAESSEELASAADAYRRLSEIDPGSRIEHLRRLTELSAQLGKKDQTLQAGQQLLAAGSDPDLYQFVAAAYFRIGATEEGLAALRLGVVRNPGTPQPLVFLAAALADRFQTDEAITLYWRAFEKTDSGLDDRLALVDQLVELSVRLNKFNDLLDRLTVFGRPPDRRREAAFYLARAYQKEGRLDKAQAELEQLARQPGNDQDPLLLQQLVSLAETRDDWPAAARNQERLVRIVRSTAHQLKLAELYARIGEPEKAAPIWADLAANQQDARQVLTAVDNLLFRGQNEEVVRITGRLLRAKPDNWEVLYREGLALTQIKDRQQDASARFRAILDLARPDDELSLLIQPETNAPLAATAPVLIPALERLQAIAALQSATGLYPDDDDRRRPSLRPTLKGNVNLPVDFRHARLAATAWSLALAREDDKEAQRALIERFRRDRGTSARAGWDWYYLNLLVDNDTEAQAAALALSRDPDPTGRWMYLLLYANGLNDLNHRLECYQTIRSKRPDWLGEADRKGGLRRLYLDLKAADRDQEADKLYKELLDAALRPAAAEAALRLAASRRDVDGVLAMWGRLLDLRGSPTGLDDEQVNTVRQLMETLAQEKEETARANLRRLLDGILASLRKSPAASGSGVARPSSRGTDRYSGFPSPNRYYPDPALSLLETVYRLHFRQHQTEALVAHYRGQLGKVAAADRPAIRLTIGYLLWWGGDQTGALDEVAAAAKDDPGLRLELAGLLAQLGRSKDALAEADKDTGVDPDTIRRREWLCLQLARKLGDDNRARVAAARLAAIRLAPEETLSLAREMRRLKMPEQAEDALLRFSQYARGQEDLLARVMDELLDLGRRDRAAVVAAHIVRLSPARRPEDRESAARTRALTLLRQESKLAGLIASLEAESARTPRYRPPLDTLAGLYWTEADVPNLRRTLRRLADLSPADPAARAEVFRQLSLFGFEFRKAGKDPKKAREAYEAAVAEWDDQHPRGKALASDRPLLLEILLNAATANVRVGDRPAAVKHLKRAEESAERPFEFLELASEVRRAGLQEEARPLLDQTMKLLATGRPEFDRELEGFFDELIEELTAQRMGDRAVDAAVLALRVDRAKPRRDALDGFDRETLRSSALEVLRQPENKARLGELIRSAETEYKAAPTLRPLLALEGFYLLTEDVSSFQDTLHRIAKVRGASSTDPLAVPRALSVAGYRLKDAKKKRAAHEAAVAEWDALHPDGKIPKDDRGFAALILEDAAVAAAQADDRSAALKYLKRAVEAEDGPDDLLILASRIRKAGLPADARPLLLQAAPLVMKQPRPSIETLITLLDELIEQEQPDSAVEVAVLLLLTDAEDDLDVRRSRSRYDRRYRDVDWQRTRALAVDVLRKSGKLPKLIAGVEAEYKMKPGLPALRRLELLYKVAEDISGLRTTLRRIADSEKENPDSAMEVVYSLKRFGDELKERNGDRKKVREAYEAAVAEWQERVKNTPVPGSLLTALARVCLDDKDRVTARKYLRQAETSAADRVKKEPDSNSARVAYVDILEQVAEIARAGGDDDEAKRAEKLALGGYQEQVANPPKNQFDREDLADRLKTMAEARQKKRDWAGARVLFKMRIQMFEKLATPGEPDRNLFDAIKDLSDGEAEQNNLAAAIKVFRKAVALTEDWVKANPNSDDAQGEHEYALRILGEYLRKSGELTEAADAFQAAIEVNRAGLAQASSNINRLIGLSYALDGLADVRRNQRNLPASRNLQVESVRLLEEAIARDPDNIRLTEALSYANESLGRMVEYPTVARDAWRKALDHYELRLRRDPRDEKALQGAAEAYEWLGDLEDRLGNPIAAVEHCRKAVELKTKVFAIEGNIQARHSLGYAHVWLASVSARAGDQAGAIEQRRRVIEIRESVLKEEPDNDEYRKAAADAYENLGIALRRTGESTAAKKQLEKSISLWREVRQSFSYQRKTPLEYQAGPISQLAYLYLEQGDIPSARTEYRKALDTVEEAVKTYPNLPGPRVSRTSYLESMGHVALVAGDFAEAEKWYKQAIEQLEALEKEKLLTNPDDETRLPYARRFLAVAQNARKAMKDLEFASKQPTRQASADLLFFRASALARAGDLKGAVETAETLRKLDAMDPENLFDTARCYGRIAALIAKGRPLAKLSAKEKEARDDAVRKALEALTAAVAAKLPDRRQIMTSEDLDAVRGEPGYRDLVATFTSPSGGK